MSSYLAGSFIIKCDIRLHCKGWPVYPQAYLLFDGVALAIGQLRGEASLEEPWR